MKKTFLVLFSVLFLNQHVLAVTLFEALTEAYKNNTDLNAERENINISEEDLKISKSNYLPTVTISGSKSQEDTSKLTNRAGVEQSVNDADPATQSIKIEQTLLDFGRNADIQKNEIGIDLAVIKLLKKEQEVLLKAIEAYSNLILANEKARNIQKRMGFDLKPGVLRWDMLDAGLKSGSIDTPDGTLPSAWITKRKEAMVNLIDQEIVESVVNLKGEKVVILGNSSRLKDGGTLQIWTDITDIRKKEKEVKESQNKVWEAEERLSNKIMCRLCS